MRRKRRGWKERGPFRLGMERKKEGETFLLCRREGGVGLMHSLEERKRSGHDLIN